MPANDEEKTPLLDARYNVDYRAHCQQQQQQHHIVTVPAMVKDSTAYEVLYATSDYSHGLSLEELLLYANDPKWLLLRRTFFGLFGLTLLLTFLAACTLAYFHNADIDYCSRLATTVVPSANRLNPMTIMIPTATTTWTIHTAQNTTEASGSSVGSVSLLNVSGMLGTHN